VTRGSPASPGEEVAPDIAEARAIEEKLQYAAGHEMIIDGFQQVRNFPTRLG